MQKPSFENWLYSNTAIHRFMNNFDIAHKVYSFIKNQIKLKDTI